MNNIIIFKPQKEVTVEQNISNFIEFAKTQLHTFGSDLVWDDDIWDVSGHFERRGRNNSIRINWNNFETANTSNKFNKQPMEEPFLSFAKAFLRNDQTENPNTRLADYLNAFRCVEKALREICGTADPKMISPDILNHAVTLLKEKFKNPYAFGNALELFYKYIREKNLSLTALPWKSPIRFQRTSRDLVGEESIEFSKEKCPTDACLRAIAKIFVESNHPVDKLCSSTALIQLAQPCRIGEILTIPYGCEVDNIFGDGGYGLRWWPEKGGTPTVKQILASWVDLVKEAVSRIKEETNEARKIARWYEDNTEIYIPDEYAYWRNESYLPSSVVKDLLCFSKVTLARFLQNNNIKLIKGKEKKELNPKNCPAHEGVISKSDIYSAIKTMLPVDFPYIDIERDLKYSDALYVVPWNFFRRDKFVYSKVMFEPVTVTEIANQYGMNSSPSMFTHNDLTEIDGSKIQFNTHSARHWQNSIANYNHVPDIFIALWSGRKDPAQNQAYFHTTKEERFDQIQAVLKGNPIVPISGQTSTEISVYQRIGLLQNSVRNLYGTAHTTDVGFCVQDFTTTPCRKFTDHITCSQHLYLKGDPRNDLLRKSLAEEEILLKHVEEESKDEERYGIDPWRIFRTQRLEILRNIVAILDNDRIPINSFFRISLNNEYHPVRVAIYNRTGKIIGDNNNGPISLQLIDQIDL